MISTRTKTADRHRPLAPERLEAIRRLAREQRAVRVDELCEALGASPATVRRDLEAMEARGELRRVHGGAVRVEGRLEEPLFEAKAGQAAREKRRIAEAALRYIGTDETLYLDGGSTVLELARLLFDRPGLTIVTNSLRAAAELSSRGPRLIVVGGELRRISQTTVGPLTRRVLADVHVDKAFMGATGIGEREGLTTTDPAEAFTKECVLAQAHEVFLLADARKFDTVSFARSGGLDQVHRVITDAPLPPRWSRILRRNGVRIDVAGTGNESRPAQRGTEKKRTRKGRTS